MPEPDELGLFAQRLESAALPYMITGATALSPGTLASAAWPIRRMGAVSASIGAVCAYSRPMPANVFASILSGEARLVVGPLGLARLRLGASQAPLRGAPSSSPRSVVEPRVLISLHNGAFA